MKRTFLLLLSCSFILLAEPSVYSDADFIDVESVAKKNSREIFVLKQKIANLNEKIEGLKTLLNSQANQIAKLEQKSNNNYAEIINQLAQKIAELETKIANQKTIIETKRVAVQNEPTSKPQVINEPKETPKKESQKKLSKRELYKKGVLDFNNKRYSSAKKIFQELLLKGYKAAESNFYLGEIAFYRKRYKEAISYYQNSATLNEEAIYMDKLLLHTAIALKKIGKSQEAQSFFQAIVDSYPKSASAKEAKKYLK